MHTEIDALNAFYAAVNRNDMTSMIKDFDVDIVRVEPTGFDTAGTFRGIVEVQANVSKGRSTWAEGSCEPEGFHSRDEKIVVFLHARVRVHGADEWSGGRFADGFVFRAGRIVEYRTFWERADALRWADLDPTAVR